MQNDLPPSDQSARRATAAEAVHALEQTLEHFETLLGTLEQSTRGGRGPVREELAEVARSERDVLQQLAGALAQLGLEAQRLAQGASSMADVAARLEERIGAVGAATERSREIEAATPREPLAPDEPRFEVNARPVGIVLASVPGFQGLMDAQRALASMPAAEGASVVGYKNGEAAIELVLSRPVSAREIVEGLSASTGHQLLIEEARPDDLRLRLRFAG